MRPNPSTRQKPKVGCLVTLLLVGLAICALIVTIRHQQTAQQEKERAQREASDRRLEDIQKKGEAKYRREVEAVGILP